MQRAAEDVHAHTDEILRSWDGMLDALPWLAVPADQRFDDFPGVIGALLDFALRPGQTEQTRHLVHTCAANGHQRREAGFSVENIFREYQALRVALWNYLRTRQASSPAALRLILGIDRGLALAQTAALRGFNRDHFEAAGRWPEALDELIREYPAADRE